MHDTVTCQTASNKIIEKNLQVRGTPCKCCSVVNLDRTRIIVNITFSHHFCSWYMTKHISHTCGRSCRPVRYLSSSTHIHVSKRCLATARVSIITYRTLRTKQRRGFKVSGFWTHCHEGNTTSSHLMTPLLYSSCSTCSSKLCFVFTNRLFLRLSEIRPIPWFLTEREAEVLVDQSTGTNLNKFWTRDERSRLFAKFNYAAKLRTDPAFCTPPSL